MAYKAFPNRLLLAAIFTLAIFVQDVNAICWTQTGGSNRGVCEGGTVSVQCWVTSVVPYGCSSCSPCTQNSPICRCVDPSIGCGSSGCTNAQCSGNTNGCDWDGNYYCSGTASIDCSTLIDANSCGNLAGCTWTPVCDFALSHACTPGNPAPDCCSSGLECSGGTCQAVVIPSCEQDTGQTCVVGSSDPSECCTSGLSCLETGGVYTCQTEPSLPCMQGISQSCVAGSTISNQCCTSGYSCIGGTCQSSSPGTGGIADFCKSDQFNDVLLLSGIGALAMAALVALAYMFGEFFQNARALVWAKAEALQVFASLVVVLMVFFALSSFCDIRLEEVKNVFGLPNLPAVYEENPAYSTLNIYEGGLLYLERLAGAGLAEISSLRYNLGAYEMRTSYSKFTCDSICLFSLSSVNEAVFGGETMNLAITNNLMGTATVAYLSAIFQYFAMLFIVKGLFIEFLPLAIVVRSVPFMRQFGGALVAIFLALYIMYPLMLVVDAFVAPGLARYAGYAPMYDRTAGGGDGCAGTVVFYDPGPPESGINCISEGCSGSAPACSGYTNPLTCLGSGLGCSWTGIITREDEMQDAAGTSEGSMRDLLSHDTGLGGAIRVNVLIFLASVFLPALNFIVIAAVARDLSHFLGEEADVTRLGQMV